MRCERAIIFKFEIFIDWQKFVDIPVPAMSATGLAYATDICGFPRTFALILGEVGVCPQMSAISPQMSVPLSKPADFCGYFSISAGANFLRRSAALRK